MAVGEHKLGQAFERLGALFGAYVRVGPDRARGGRRREAPRPARPAPGHAVEAFRMLCRHSRFVQEFGAVREPEEIARRERLWERAIDDMEFGTDRPAASLSGARVPCCSRPASISPGSGSAAPHEACSAHGPKEDDMSRIAITGAASFVGSRLLRRLVEQRGAALGGGAGRHPSPRRPPQRELSPRRPDAARRRPQARWRCSATKACDTVVHAAFFTDPRRDTTLLARAGVDRHHEPDGRPAPPPASSTWCSAPSRPSTGRAGRTPPS